MARIRPYDSNRRRGATKQGSYWGSTFWNVTDSRRRAPPGPEIHEKWTHSGQYPGYTSCLRSDGGERSSPIFSNSNTYGTAGTTLTAYKGNVSAQPPTATNVPTTEITSYSNIATDNGVYESTTESVGYAAHRFEFTINQSASDVENITATWVGRGSGTRSNGEKLYIWNGTAYEFLAEETTNDRSTLSGTKTTGPSNNYIDGNGKVILLVVQNKNGGSTLETDYVKLGGAQL